MDYRSKISKSNPNMLSKDVTKELGKMWSTISYDEKIFYTQKACLEKSIGTTTSEIAQCFEFTKVENSDSAENSENAANVVDQIIETLDAESEVDDEHDEFNRKNAKDGHTINSICYYVVRFNNVFLWMYVFYIFYSFLTHKTSVVVNDVNKVILALPAPPKLLQLAPPKLSFNNFNDCCVLNALTAAWFLLILFRS
uniref:HMG box domain-containing protein n=1 Tax=viral metagenome TaxID=1070528 RepID=A0A6C0KFD4_9ZZZZ